MYICIVYKCTYNGYAQGLIALNVPVYYKRQQEKYIHQHVEPTSSTCTCSKTSSKSEWLALTKRVINDKSIHIHRAMRAICYSSYMYIVHCISKKGRTSVTL